MSLIVIAVVSAGIYLSGDTSARDSNCTFSADTGQTVTAGGGYRFDEARIDGDCVMAAFQADAPYFYGPLNVDAVTDANGNPDEDFVYMPEANRCIQIHQVEDDWVAHYTSNDVEAWKQDKRAFVAELDDFDVNRLVSGIHFEMTEDVDVALLDDLLQQVRDGASFDDLDRDSVNIVAARFGNNLSLLCDTTWWAGQHYFEALGGVFGYLDQEGNAPIFAIDQIPQTVQAEDAFMFVSSGGLIDDQGRVYGQFAFANWMDLHKDDDGNFAAPTHEVLAIALALHHAVSDTSPYTG